MLILGIESSAKAASAALVRDGELVGQYFQCSGLTHSATLLPMAEQLLASTGTDKSELDAVAVARGPGSFTGVRIGVAAVKGLCWALEKPAIGVSTLEAMAWNGANLPEGSLVCCCMDARRSQVYNALFSIKDGRPERLVPDRAVSLAELAADLAARDETPFLTGDGARLVSEYLGDRALPHTLARGILLQQSAWGVCMAAEGKSAESAGALLPVYLRLSQAERERQARMQSEQHN